MNIDAEENRQGQTEKKKTRKLQTCRAKAYQQIDRNGGK